MDAITVYRETFRPSEWLVSPYVMLGYNVFAAETDQEGAFLASSVQQAFVELRSGRPSQLKPPVKGYLQSLAPIQRAQLEAALSCSAIGSPASVKEAVASFVKQTGADELMVTSQIYDHEARLRSYELLASCWYELREFRSQQGGCRT